MQQKTIAYCQGRATCTFLELIKYQDVIVVDHDFIAEVTQEN